MITFDLLALNTVYVFFNKIIIPTNSRNRPLKKGKEKDKDKELIQERGWICLVTMT